MVLLFVVCQILIEDDRLFAIRSLIITLSNASDNYLTIDFCVSVEEYETKYAVEQQFELGKTFLLWLDKGLMNEAFRKNNPDFDSNSLKEYIITLGKEHSWFSDTIDWSLVE